MADQSEKDGARSNPPLPPQLPSIPEHVLVRCIGEGSYGQVWLVKSVLGTYRAAKVVFRRNFSSDRPYEREFNGIQEYEPFSRNHEGLVDVLQVGKNDAHGYFYYVMELADDQFTRGVIDPQTYSPRTLAEEIRLRSRIPSDECVQIGLTLTSALLHLHRHRLVHRDIKPENIIYIGGRVKLADIGLVAQVRSTRTNVGTEGFSPPEGSGTPQADVYSLGKVLYEMSTGKDRFDYPEPSTSLGALPDRHGVNRLTRVIHKACADELEKRYASAQVMHEDLKRLNRGGPSSRQKRKNQALLILALIVSVCGIIVVSALFNAAVHSPNSAAHLHLGAWVGPTNQFRFSSSSNSPAFPPPSEGNAYFVLPVKIASELLESREMPIRDAPAGVTQAADASTVWRTELRRETFWLQAGLDRVTPVGFAASSTSSSGVVESDGDLLRLYTPFKPEGVDVELVFAVSKRFVPTDCSFTFATGLVPVVVPLTASSELSGHGVLPER